VGPAGEAVGAAELVVNATADRHGRRFRADDEDLPFPLDALRPGQVLADLVYHPIETALLRGARDRGADVVDGLGMLVHAGRRSKLKRWTAGPAPVAIMRAAASMALDPLESA